MAIKELICINCPLGCPLRVETDEAGKVISVSGNTCKRGEDYGKKEVTSPSRTLTTTVAVLNGKAPVVSVRTKGEIPKEKLFSCMELLRRVTLQAPVRLGDVVAADLDGTGVDVIATKTVEQG